jgi:fructose-6-phosphate aldolase 2
MLYLLDTADLDAIRHCNEFYPLAGVTTNPSILARSGGDFWQTLLAIREIIGAEKALHVQTRGVTAQQMVQEGLLLQEKLGGEFYLKIPVCEEGLKATMELKKLGIGVTVTAIFTPAQALMAAKAGADFVAPYVNRLDSIGANGAQVVADIVEEFAVHGLPTKVLAASFKNVQQVHNCALTGCQSVTVTADILKALISHPMTDKALAGFDADWSAAFGDKTILEL